MHCGELYAGGWHVASYVGGSTYFNHADWLGTVRVRTGPTGAILTNESYASLPFGDCLTQAGGLDCNYGVGGTPAHFTDQDRDTESGLDHFMFRQYSSTQGRWMTPDPAGMAAVILSNPQTLNRYGYVGDNPVNATDLLGLVIKNELWNPDDDRFYNEWQLCAYEGICDEGSGATLPNDVDPGGELTIAMHQAETNARNALQDKGCSNAVTGGTQDNLASVNGLDPLSAVQTGYLGYNGNALIIAATVGTRITFDSNNVTPALGPMPVLGKPYAIRLATIGSPAPLVPFLVPERGSWLQSYALAGHQVSS